MTYKTYNKTGKNWVVSYECDDAGRAAERLAGDLIAKKLNGCKWIKSIKRVQLYSHVEITVTYTDNVKTVYVVPATL